MLVILEVKEYTQTHVYLTCHEHAMDMRLTRQGHATDMPWACVGCAMDITQTYHLPTLSYNIHNIVSNIFHHYGEYSSQLLVASTASPSLHPLRIARTCIFITKSNIIFTGHRQLI